MWKYEQYIQILTIRIKSRSPKKINYGHKI